MASNYSINLADDVEPVTSFSFNINFNGNIVIKAKKNRLKEVEKYHTRYVIWVDESKLSQGNVGATTYWKSKNLNR